MDPNATGRGPDDGASTDPPTYHILKRLLFGSMITDGWPTPGRSHRPSPPAEKTAAGFWFESCDIDQEMPSDEAANPIVPLLVPDAMLNHMRYTDDSSTTDGFATAISPMFASTV